MWPVLGLRISIHAPVKGATRERSNARHPDQISIHAPVKGATIPFAVGYQGVIISIHAPVKGATTGRIALSYSQ